MEKNYFHNNRSLDENLNEIRSSQRKYTDKKKVVDINKLLNRVKINESDKKKKNITFIFCTILCLSLSAYIFFN